MTKTTWKMFLRTTRNWPGYEGISSCDAKGGSKGDRQEQAGEKDKTAVQGQGCKRDDNEEETRTFHVRNHFLEAQATDG